MMEAHRQNAHYHRQGHHEDSAEEVLSCEETLSVNKGLPLTMIYVSLLFVQNLIPTVLTRGVRDKDFAETSRLTRKCSSPIHWVGMVALISKGAECESGRLSSNVE